MQTPYVSRQLPALLTATVSAAIALGFAPPVFDRVFSIAPLLPADAQVLWVVAGILLLAALIVAALRSPRLAALLLGVLLVCGAELGARAWVRSSHDIHQRSELDKLLRIARGEAFEHLQHPFLHHVGNPELLAVPYLDERAHLALLPQDEWHPYNDFGFPGSIRPYVKEPRVLRVACLGGSTTATGYPQALEAWLDDRLPQGWRAEVLNFGIGGYTTAHSLVNYTLNVVDFAPDVVIVHHAWNDYSAVRQGCQLRGDYAHFAADRLPDATPSVERWVAPSVIWRLLRSKRSSSGAGAGTSAARLASAHRPEDCDEVDPRWPYRRNLETMIRQAAHDSSLLVLTTQPHADQPLSAQARFIDDCNDDVRALHRSHPQTLLVDLASDHGPRGEADFMDLCHMVPEGVRWKATRIGEVLLPSLVAMAEGRP